MAANRNSRYYSQSYEPVENPALPQSSHQPSQPDGDFGDYETYRGFKTVSDLDITEPGAASGLPPRQQKAGWSTKKKLIIIGGAIAACIIIGLAVGLGVGLTQSKDEPYDYVPAKGDLQVTNSAAFDKGATHDDPYDSLQDGIGAGKDEYTYYDGPAKNFPGFDEWISFEDMWSGNLHFFKTSCKANGFGSDQTDDEIDSIYNAIQDRAKASLVDHRFILATILQETHGCAKVKPTESYGGVQNPGLMQSNNGTLYNSHHANQSIYDMVQDGTQGTASGDGLVMNLVYYHNAYTASRGYNSGTIAVSGNLTDGVGATDCYVSDLANRLTGWTNAPTKCFESPEE